ncbi:MAG TPA: glucuronate isomerase [Candidatus Limiplasma sp.]|nr:glucuronate isomerase [Candidatus Limiplasma sp.]HPS81229.1 glucuronate isomerase [Candidatus Limiplasma sp.]
MKPFMDQDFLLESDAAKTLYHTYAKDMPICDYHCHVVVKEIWEDQRYDTLTQVWLSGDHYKWRAMRLNGIPERLITGDAPAEEKFIAYARTVASAVGNPLYHWTHLELQRYFGIFEPLNEATAPAIWEQANRVLRDGLTTRKMILQSNVKTICSTDDPADDLRYHRQLREDTAFPVQVLPSFRPDQALDVRNPGYSAYIARLGQAAGLTITDWESLKAALANRLDYFDAMGCRVSDHAFAYVPYAEADEKTADSIMRRALNGETLTQPEEEQYKTLLLQTLAALYHKKGMVMQLHIGPMRRVNAAMTRQLGADTGFDSVNDLCIAEPLGRFLNSLNERGLPKTILYCLNPKDNYVLGTMLGNFADGGLAGKMQFGSAWWFNDHREGMVEQMTTLANLGMLSQFTGMLTDSRSFTSYPRFEYFRRILCNLIGSWMEAGEIAPDMDRMGKLVQDVCYNNIERLMRR